MRVIFTFSDREILFLLAAARSRPPVNVFAAAKAKIVATDQGSGFRHGSKTNLSRSIISSTALLSP